jgi:hypothetical protein
MNESRLTIIEGPYFNETKTCAEWARDKRCKVSYSALIARINEYNWEPEKSLTTPSRNKKKHAKSR